MRGDRRTIPRKLPGQVDMMIGDPTRGPTEKEITMTMVKKDRKIIIKMKELVEIVGGETEGAMGQRELDPMATGAEKHEDTARRFHAWGNLL